MAKRRDPKVGTGKKPKGSGRRLYTDENPKDTVSIKYATVQDAKDTVAKVKRTRKPFARLIQILTVGEQRSKYGIFRIFICIQSSTAPFWFFTCSNLRIAFFCHLTIPITSSPVICLHTVITKLFTSFTI